MKRSKCPSYVIIRDAGTGRLVRIPIGAIPKIFWPETWYENPYWMYSGALSRTDIVEFFGDTKREIRADLAYKLATYILDFVQNMAAVVYLMSSDKEGYLDFMKSCIGGGVCQAGGEGYQLGNQVQRGIRGV